MKPTRDPRAEAHRARQRAMRNSELALEEQNRFMAEAEAAIAAGASRQAIPPGPPDTAFDAHEEELQEKAIRPESPDTELSGADTDRPDGLASEDDVERLVMTDTLHFVAENFEAVAHRRSEDNMFGTYWVVTVSGSPSCSLQTVGLDSSEMRVYLLHSGGWAQLCEHKGDVAGLLALAISLVYSVPGVRQLSEREGRINELKRTGCVDPDIADELRAQHQHCVMCNGSGYAGPAIGMSGMRQVCECRLDRGAQP